MKKWFFYGIDIFGYTYNATWISILVLFNNYVPLIKLMSHQHHLIPSPYSKLHKTDYTHTTTINYPYTEKTNSQLIQHYTAILYHNSILYRVGWKTITSLCLRVRGIIVKSWNENIICICFYLFTYEKLPGASFGLSKNFKFSDIFLTLYIQNTLANLHR